MNWKKQLSKLFKQVLDIIGLNGHVKIVPERRKKHVSRGNIPWDEPYERRRSKHKYKE